MNHVEQALKFGSIALALMHKFVTPSEILDHILNIACTEMTMLAYKFVCELIPPNLQYCSDNWHFLVKKPEYAPIAMAFDLDIDIGNRNVDPSDTILPNIIYKLNEFRNDTGLINLLRLILRGEATSSYVKTKLHLVIQMRILPSDIDDTSREHNNMLLQGDLLNKIDMFDFDLDQLVSRITVLKDGAPDYYKMIEPLYHNFFQALYHNMKYTDPSVLQELNIMFPKIISHNILQYSKFTKAIDISCYKLSFMNVNVAGYILGLPIHEICITKDHITASLQILSAQGLDTYIQNIQHSVETLCEPKLEFLKIPEQQYCNDMDVMMYAIVEYGLFDIVWYRAGAHIYRFTRPEYEQILKSKKNPWTNEIVPESVLHMIIARISMATSLELPQARTVRELIMRCESDSLYIMESKPESEHEPILDLHTELTDLLRGLSSLNRIMREEQSSEEITTTQPTLANARSQSEEINGSELHTILGHYFSETQLD